MRDDRGLGLTEVMVAMLILLLVLTAMVSALIMALSKTSAATTQASAAEAVQARIESARAQSASGSCTVIENAITTPQTVTDGRGVAITVVGTVTQPNGDPCEVAGAGDDGDPAQVLRITVSATTTVPGMTNPLARTTTDVFLKYKAP